MEEKYLFEKYVKRGDIVYDIGANIGNTVAQFVNLGALKVYAFEPSPNNFPKLEVNTLNWPVVCYNVALHNRNYSCQTQFKDCATDFLDSNGKKQDTVQEITYVVLDNFILARGIPDPQIIKIDIEGMEGIVMNTMERYLTKVRPIIFLEIHAQPKELDNQNYLDNPHFTYPEDGGFDFNKLKEYGYSIEYSDGSFVPDYEDWNPKSGTHAMWILKPR